MVAESVLVRAGLDASSTRGALFMGGRCAEGSRTRVAEAAVRFGEESPSSATFCGGVLGGVPPRSRRFVPACV